MEILLSILILCSVSVSSLQPPNYAKCAVITNDTRHNVTTYVTYTSDDAMRVRRKIISPQDTHKFKEETETIEAFDIVYPISRICVYKASGKLVSQEVQVEGIVDCVNRTITEVDNHLTIN